MSELLQPHPTYSRDDKGTGLIIHHDIRNENYLAVNGVLRLGANAEVAQPDFKPKSRLHRQWRRFFQGNTPRCTGYGLATILATADEYTRSKLTGDDWYWKNVAFDKSQGRDFGPDNGATVVAAMEVGRAAGVFDRYEWFYTMDSAHRIIALQPFVVGAIWYREMWERDDEGIVKFRATDQGTSAGGHFFVINGYDAERDLWRNPETWNDGDYWIPGDVLFRQLREDGEFAVPTEIKKVA